jgi:hypothetical protein
MTADEKKKCVTPKVRHASDGRSESWRRAGAMTASGLGRGIGPIRVAWLKA